MSPPGPQVLHLICVPGIYFSWWRRSYSCTSYGFVCCLLSACCFFSFHPVGRPSVPACNGLCLVVFSRGRTRPNCLSIGRAGCNSSCQQSNRVVQCAASYHECLNVTCSNKLKLLLVFLYFCACGSWLRCISADEPTPSSESSMRFRERTYTTNGVKAQRA